MKVADTFKHVRMNIHIINDGSRLSMQLTHQSEELFFTYMSKSLHN